MNPENTQPRGKDAGRVMRNVRLRRFCQHLEMTVGSHAHKIGGHYHLILSHKAGSLAEHLDLSVITGTKVIIWILAAVTVIRSFMLVGRVGLFAGCHI